MTRHPEAVSALLRASNAPTLAAAASHLAVAGVPVFPCAPGGKRPITARGFLDATTNRQQVQAWWRGSPWANIGIPTGQPSGMVVVDVDVHGTNGFVACRRARDAGLLSGWGAIVRSPSGGLHAYYPADGVVEQRSWQAGRAGIDFRGDGGYIIAPPSRRIIDGEHVPYRVTAMGKSTSKVLDSKGLRDFLDPPPPPRPQTQRSHGELDVQRIAEWVARRPENERNHGLFWGACKFAEQGVGPAEAFEVLTPAAMKAGLGEREAVRTIRSAYRIVRPTPRAGPSGGVGRGEDAWYSRADVSTAAVPGLRRL